MKIVLLGPPGAGKGTQAKQICNSYSIPHISTGDMFRKNISEKTELGIKAKGYMDKGLLVPDALTISIVKDRLGEDDCKNGFLLDGFPRTVEQAEAFNLFLGEKIDAALLIQVPRESILDRMTGRRVCPVCGASYHLKFNPPKIDNKCDNCGSTLIQRKDDNEETVKDRIDVYYKQTEPLANFYKSAGVLCTVDGSHDIKVVFNDILGVLGKN